MAVVALDTHAVVKELQAAGFSEAQAEAVTRAVRRGQDLDLSNLATKVEVEALRAGVENLRVTTKAEAEGLRATTKAEIDGLRADTRADIAGLRTEIAGLRADVLKWVIGAIGVQTVVIPGTVVGLIRTLVR